MPGQTLRLSIVIPAYDCAETIGAQLQAIADQEVVASGESEIIVADNGSTDGTLTVVDAYRRVHPRLMVVDASSRPGASHARNVGVHEAIGEYVLFCDSDDVVASGWLDAMARALETAPFVAARLEHRGINPSWSVSRAGRAPNPKGWWKRRPAVPPPTAYAPSLGIRRELHERIGGFDTTFREGGEDNDYCYRAQIARSATHLRSHCGRPLSAPHRHGGRVQTDARLRKRKREATR